MFWVSSACILRVSPLSSCKSMYDDDEGDEEDVTQSRVAEKGGTGLTSHLHSTDRNKK